VAEIKNFVAKKVKRVKVGKINEKSGVNNFFVSFERVSNIPF
jgi:hypothetical protein